MDKIVLAALIVNCALCAASVVFVFVHLSKKETAVLCVKETGTTILLGVMISALGMAVCVMKLVDPAVSGTDNASYLYIAGSSLICQLLGSFSFLFGSVKRILAFDDRLEYVSSFGRHRAIAWDEVVRVERPLVGRIAKLICADGRVIPVSGEPKRCEELLAYAKTRIPKASGKELLHQVETHIR